MALLPPSSPTTFTTTHTHPFTPLSEVNAASQPTHSIKKADASHLPLSSFVYWFSLPLRTLKVYTELTKILKMFIVVTHEK